MLVEDTCRRATTALEPWLPLLATLTSSVKRAGEAQDVKMRKYEKAFRQDLRKGQRLPFVRALNFAANQYPEVPGRRCAKAAASASACPFFSKMQGQATPRDA